MHKRKTAAALLIIAIISSLLLSSCGIITINGNEPPRTDAPETTSSPKITDTDPPLPDTAPHPSPEIPDPEKWNIRKNEADSLLNGQINIDYSGKSIYLIDATGTFSDPMIENNIYSEARYESNKNLEKKYGFNLTIAPANGEILLDEFKATVNSGNTYCDILSVSLIDTAKYIDSGLIQNLRKLPFFEDSGDYSISSFDSSRGMKNTLYFSVGYGTLAPKDMQCIYFNRTVMKNAGIDLYSEISAGSFTAERLYEIMTATSSKNVNASDFDPMLTSITLSPTKFFDTGYKKQFDMKIDTFKTAASDASVFYKLLTQNSLALAEGETAESAFEAGKAAFYFGTLDEIEKMSERKVLFGLAPMPKYSAESEYQTPVSPYTAALMITSNTEKSEMCSIALSSIHAASYKWMLDSAGLHYGTYYLPDIHSLNMIKIILENPVLDFSISASGLTDWYKLLVFDGINRKAISPGDTLDNLYIENNLGWFRDELSMVYK